LGQIGSVYGTVSQGSSGPRRAHKATKQASRRRECSSYLLFLASAVPWPLQSQQHSTPLPSSRRYSNRYEPASYGTFSLPPWWCTGDVEKPLVITIRFSLSEYPVYLSGLERADERTRTADLLQLRVIGQRLQGIAEVCKFRVGKGFCVPCIARDCRVLCPGQGQIVSVRRGLRIAGSSADRI
jgi:hypothetical protein